ncbi:hypothetical protein ACFL27_24785, partial [candidate division CSSED10-310 bacterium]
YSGVDSTSWLFLTTKDTFPANYKRPLTINRYLYVGGNPVNATDLFGLELWYPTYDEDPEPGAAGAYGGGCNGFKNSSQSYGLPFGRSEVLYLDWPEVLGWMSGSGGSFMDFDLDQFFAAVGLMDLAGSLVSNWVLDKIFGGIKHFRICNDCKEMFTSQSPYYYNWSNSNLKIRIRWKILMQGCITVKKTTPNGTVVETIKHTCSPTGLNSDQGIERPFEPGYHYTFDTNIPDNTYFNYARVYYDVVPVHGHIFPVLPINLIQVQQYVIRR